MCKKEEERYRKVTCELVKKLTEIQGALSTSYVVIDIWYTESVYCCLTHSYTE